MEQEEFLCVRCARHTKTCCQGTEIYTTPGDTERIRNHTGNNDFYEFQRPNDPVYGNNDDDPLWRDRVFRPDGTRRILKHQQNGDCMFLGQAGCTLPLDVRPLVCRLYPFDYIEDGIKDQPAVGCPVELLRPGQHLFVALDMKRDDAKRWHRQLYDEIRLEPEPQMPCTVSV